VQIKSRHESVVKINRSYAGSVDKFVISRMRSIVQRVERVQTRCDVWRSELQVALIQCGDFHQTIDNLCSWLNRIEQELTRVEPVHIAAPQSELRRKHAKLQVSYLV